MNKYTKQKTPFKIKNQSGQISIFLAIVLVVIFSLVAFVTNVGLFVKAKINLQNAVDSAAWSGAAVQARQLSNISHLNYEMRNTYKEWMFKYYVLGTISNTKTHTGNVSAGGDVVDFRLQRFDPGNATSAGDRYNFPSTCIHFGSSKNICNLYQVPGLPRFKVAGLPNVSEQFEAAVNSFVEQKAKNCSNRTSYNFAAAMNYAYSTGKQSLTEVPIVAAYRKGAWIEATELALRMRNLEMIANRPPVGSICLQGSCDTTQSDLLQVNNTYQYAINERPLKAFSAAVKSLSGSGSKARNELYNKFKLTELSPNPYQAAPNALSNFLIPQDAVFSNLGQEVSVTIKHYVDLIPMIFNYVTFFTTFGPRSGDGGELLDEISGTEMEAACASTKTALPVPGYIMGFYKNPEVLTYYAVKGETEYVGLLNPFSTNIKLSAYAAAKPFGGRVGPMLVAPAGSNTGLKTAVSNAPRQSDAGGAGRTSNYVIGFVSNEDTRPITAGGVPIPRDQSFYVDNESDIIGGTKALTGADIKYSLPNLVYTFPSSGQPLSNNKIPKTRFMSPTSLPSNQVKAGLFNKEQYLNFRGNLGGANEAGATLDQNSIEQALSNVRGPTTYDALNYMVPTIKESGSIDLEGVPTYKPLPQDPSKVTLFAPLFGTGTLYTNQTRVNTVVNEYIDLLKPSVDRYLESLKDYSDALRPTGSASDSAAQAEGRYLGAANLIHEDPLATPDFGDCSQVSIAAKFNFFFTSTNLPAPENCDITPLKVGFSEYILNKGQNGAEGKYYVTSYSQKGPSAINNAQAATGYMPGETQGADVSGMDGNINRRRNYYSTKLIGVDTVTSTSGGYEGNWFYVESNGNPPFKPQDLSSALFLNTLNSSQLNEFKNPDGLLDF